MKNVFSYERYHRQLILKEFGEAGQQKLADASVLVVGAGGLGCPVLQYLVASGVGTIGIVDDDDVSLDNLHRQPLFTTADIGKSKAATAADALRKLNPESRINSYEQRLEPANAPGIMQDYDLVIDCGDNFATRYMINDACVLLGKPLVYAAVSQYEGQVAIFDCRKNNSVAGIHYRDLFPEPPAPGEVESCSEAGVLGVLPGIIGTMQAAEAIKFIAGIGRPLTGRLYTFNALTNRGLEIELQKRSDSDALVPGSIEEFRQTDYVSLCDQPGMPFEISVGQFEDMIAAGDVDIIDVREPGELPEVSEFACRCIPLSRLTGEYDHNGSAATIFFCQSGQRSARAARWLLRRDGKERWVYSLAGGILQYKKQREEQKV